MSQQSVAIGNPIRKYFAIISVLLAVLVGLLFAYFMLTKPPVSRSAKEQDDFRHLFSIYGFEGDLLRRPSGVALDSMGRIFVADTGKQRVLVFDQSGNFVAQFGDQGQGEYKIKDPISVATTLNGQIFVLSKTAKKIVVYNSLFKPVNEIGFSESPLSMTIHDNKLYVTTVSGIMIGDLEGNLITTLGKSGTAPGEFQLPAGIAVDKNGSMYVADSLNYRVQALNKDGEPLWQYGKPLPSGQAMKYQGKDRKFGLPASIALDDNGYLYVVDGLNSELVVLNTKGELIETIGDIGHDDGFFYYPAGIAYAGQGKVALADKYNDRVQVFQVPFATPTSAKIFAWAPYLLLLLPVLLLWLFLRPRLQVIASEDFIRAAINDNIATDLEQAFDKLIVVPEAVGNLGDRLPAKLNLIPKPISDSEVERISSDSGLPKDQVAALALARNIKGKKVLLTGSPAVESAAKALNLATMSYDEFKDTYKGHSGRKEA